MTSKDHIVFNDFPSKTLPMQVGRYANMQVLQACTTKKSLTINHFQILWRNDLRPSTLSKFHTLFWAELIDSVWVFMALGEQGISYEKRLDIGRHFHKYKSTLYLCGFIFMDISHHSNKYLWSQHSAFSDHLKKLPSIFQEIFKFHFGVLPWINYLHCIVLWRNNARESHNNK